MVRWRAFFGDTDLVEVRAQRLPTPADGSALVALDAAQAIVLSTAAQLEQTVGGHILHLDRFQAAPSG